MEFSGLWGHNVQSLEQTYFPPSRDLLTSLDVAMYGLAHGSPMSVSSFDYMFHTFAGYLTFLTAHLVNIQGRC
jgi:hypothetical protein